jgi:predicted RNase H-like nuclease (RuvC/YqgF family)
MPPSKRIGPLEDQIKQLTKELNLTRGTLKDSHAKIDDLEKRLAAKTEEASVLAGKVERENITRIANDHLREKIDELQAAVNDAKSNHKDLVETLQGELIMQRMKTAGILADLHESNRRLIRQQDQNIALREALKRVL